MSNTPIETPGDNQSPQTPTRSAKFRLSATGLLINVIIPLLLLAVGAGVVFAFGVVKPKQRPAADASRVGRLRALPAVQGVQVRSLEATDQALQLKVDGTVVPYREAKVATEVAGRIVFKSDDCEAGSVVKKGQLLMRIDPTDYELEVERLTRQKQQEYEALGEVDQEMVNTRRLIKVAKEDVALQEREVKRLQSLPRDFASKGEVDKSRSAVLQATQNLVTYENQVELFQKRRTRLEAAEQLAGTQLKVAEVNLARCEVRAPIDGVIVAEDADLNSFVARGSTIVSIDDTSKVEVATSLRMDQLYWVLDQNDPTSKTQDRNYHLPDTDAVIEYEMSGRNAETYRWKGRLMGYDGIGVDPATRTVPVRIVVDNPSQYFDEHDNAHEATGPTSLVRGMYVQVSLLIKPKTPLVVIPARALKPGNRVWQFVADESVLEEPAKMEPAQKNSSDKQGNGTSGKSSELAQQSDERTDSDESSDATEGNRFDPTQWRPGRIFVRQSVVPVDSLRVADVRREKKSRFDLEDRMWVCEVPDETIADGSFIVVSPLGSINDEGMPVRMELPVADPNSSDAPNDKSTHDNSLASLMDESGARQ